MIRSSESMTVSVRENSGLDENGKARRSWISVEKKGHG